MSHFGDLDDDVLVQLARWLSCDQVLKLRATDKRWHLVLKRPSALLGCEEVEKKVLYWVRLPLQSYMWVRLLGSGCTKLILNAEKTSGVVPVLFPGLDEALARESLRGRPGKCLPNDRADHFQQIIVQNAPGHATFVVPAFHQAHPCSE